MIRCQCPNGHKLKIKETYAGKKGKCPKCGARFLVPEAEADDLWLEPDEAEAESLYHDLPKSKATPVASGTAPKQTAKSATRRPQQRVDPVTETSTDSPKVKKPFISGVMGWSLLVLLLLFLAVLRMTIANRNQNPGAQSRRNVAAANSEVKRGADFEIEGTVVVPTAKGFTWELVEERINKNDGRSVQAWLSTNNSSETVAEVKLGVLTQIVDDAEMRRKMVESFRSSMLKSNAAVGFSGLNGPDPEQVADDRFQFKLKGLQPTGAPVYLRFQTIFGKRNTYMYEVASASRESADALFAFAIDLKEIGAQPGSAVAAVARNPTTGNSAARDTHANENAAATNPPPRKPLQPEMPLPTGRYSTIDLPAPVIDWAAGRHGEVLVLQLEGGVDASILDLAQRKIVGQIPAAEGTLVVAGAEHVLVVDPESKQIERWSLSTFEKQRTGILELPGEIQSMAMGCSASDKAIIQWFEADKRWASYATIDVESFAVQVFCTGDNSAPPGMIGTRVNNKAPTELRTSADGRVLTLRPRHNSNQMERIFLGEPMFSCAESTGSGGCILPTADGRLICGGSGVFGVGFEPIDMGQRWPVFPTTDPALILQVSTDGVIIRDVFTREDVKDLGQLTEFGKDFSSACRSGRARGGTMVADKLMHCVPALDLLITFPANQNKLFIRDLGIHAGPLFRSKDLLNVLILPGVAYDAMRAGGGRKIVTHLAEQGQIVVVDLLSHKVVGAIPAPFNALVAAGQSKVIVVDPDENRITRWSLDTFQEEQSASFELDGIARKVVMGSSCEGPAVLYWTNDRGGIFSEIDIKTLKIKQVTRAPYDKDGPGDFSIRTTGREYGGVSIRAAANGRSFGLWKGGSPTGVEVVTPGTAPHARYEHSTNGYVIPTGGNRILTARGTYTSKGSKLAFDSTNTSAFFPVAGGRHMLAMNKTETDLKTLSSGKTVATIPTPEGFGDDTFRSAQFGRLDPYRLMLDQRVYCVPALNVLATIPKSDDRVVFHDVEFNAAN